MTIQEKLKKFFERLRIQAIVAESGVSRTAISKYLNENSEPMATTALKLARALNVDVEWLIDPETNWPPIWKNLNEKGDAA